MDYDVQRFDSSIEIPKEVVIPPANEDVLKIVKSLENVIMGGKEINQAAITYVLKNIRARSWRFG